MYGTTVRALAAVNCTVRGRILEIAARERDRELHPGCRVVGAQDSLKLPGDVQFDWLRIDSHGIEILVEHKSSQLSWDRIVQRWYASFRYIKMYQHDELQWSLFAPSAVCCFLHENSRWPLAGKKCCKK